MARTLVRPSLYDEDFLAWTEQQAALVRAGRLDQLDLDNLAERSSTPWGAANGGGGQGPRRPIQPLRQK